MAKKVVLAGACRTAIGTMGGSLSTTPAADLGAIVIKEALNRAGVDPAAVDVNSIPEHILISPAKVFCISCFSWHSCRIWRFDPFGWSYIKLVVKHITVQSCSDF